MSETLYFFESVESRLRYMVVDYDPKNIPQEERKAKRHRVEMSILGRQSEYDRLVRKKNDAMIELRIVQRDKHRLEIREKDANEQVKKVDRDMMFLDTEIKRLKKTLNVL